jgi:hypothetical protein
MAIRVNEVKHSRWISKVTRAAKGAPMLVLAFALVAIHSAPAQTYKTVHRFSGGQDGAEPLATVILDNADSLYGTTSQGGNLKCDAPNSCGTIFKMWLEIMVGERGFEPPTPWSRTRCSTRLSHSPTKAE